MIPLSSRLDDTGFDALLALARRRLPALAPEWTDYNYHDPGITILELLAWVADSQIYSLGRNRLDERLAMARLLGVSPKGAIPSSGVLYPVETPAAPQVIEGDGVLKPFRDSAPRMEVAETITLLPVEIKRLATWRPGGASTDHTNANARDRAPFEPFGARGDGELRLELKQVVGATLGNGDVCLSLGFELESNESSVPPAVIPALIEIVDEKGVPLECIRDTTLGLQRNGVLILSLDADELLKPIIIRPKAGYSLRPKLLRILPNALPVEQRATFKSDFFGNDRPGQTREYSPATLFDSDEPVDGRVWRLVDGDTSFSIDSSDGSETKHWQSGRLDEAGPDDLRYALGERPDGTRITVRFGNGINGKKPALDDRVDICLRLSCGRQGVVRKPIKWVLSPQGTKWRNASAIAGGRDAQSVRQAISEANATLRDQRVLTTTNELLRALAPLKATLRIGRAEVEEGWEPGLKSPRMAATRTLIVGHEDQDAESEAWRRAIRRRLAGQIAIGERLIVASPTHVSFRIRVEAAVAPGYDPATVRKAIETELKDRFRPELKKGVRPIPDPWPLGRDVDSTAVAGWVRRVQGVQGPINVRIISGGMDHECLTIGRGALPRFTEAEIFLRESRG